ncbi:MAG: BatD family protein, partial [Cyclobacteriaceae bacterium]
MLKTYSFYLLLAGSMVLFSVFSVFAQNIKIDLGPDQIALNEAFTIKITVQNSRLRNYSEFPDIPGFEKQGTFSSSSTNIINGNITSAHSITQNYAPTRQGTFTLAPFTMNINDQEVQSPGKTITVGPPQQRQQQQSPFFSNPFDDFFNQEREPQEYIDVEEDVFFALTTNKDRVYTGEGFVVTLAYYESERNQASFRFYDLTNQLSEILKQIKPANCWEENFNIENISGRPVTINGTRYMQYPIYQAAYYPLNTDTIQFPSVPFKMVKYKVAKNPSFFGRNRQEEIKTYYTKPKQVIVKPLPAHPLRESVAVGRYQLAENISSRQLQTGESFNYYFKIFGEGNISAISSPLVPQNDNFEFYSPNVQQNISRGNYQVKGTKTYSYYGIPTEPGKFDLGNYFQWIYFNPEAEKYDTLRAGIVVEVSGESKKNNYISSS